MGIEDIDILTKQEFQKRWEKYFKNYPDQAPTPLEMLKRNFMCQEDDGTWTACYIVPCGIGENYVENFPTKAQAMLYLTCNDLSPEEIRKDFAPEPKGVFKDEPVSVLFEDRPDYTEQVLGLRPVKKRKVWRVTVEQTVSVTYFVEADTLREARDAVETDLAADLDEQVVDWSEELDRAEVQDTSVYEGDPADSDRDYESDEEPDFVVKDGRLANPS